MRVSALILAAALSGCHSIPDEAIKGIRDAGGGYFRSHGFWGSIEYGHANSDQGAADISVAPGKIEVKKPYKPSEFTR